MALAECCFVKEEAGLGARLDLPISTLRPDRMLFSETPSRMVVSTRDGADLETLAHHHGVPCARIGGVGGDALIVSTGGDTLLELPVAKLLEAWTSLERRLSQR